MQVAVRTTRPILGALPDTPVRFTIETFYTYNIFDCLDTQRHGITDRLHAEVCVDCQHKRYKRKPAMIKLLDETPFAHIEIGVPAEKG